VWLFMAGFVNWIAPGRLVRHCSNWWLSSVFTAGSGKDPESAGRGIYELVDDEVFRKDCVAHSRSRGSGGSA
jgi:hypothetical protein